MKRNQKQYKVFSENKDDYSEGVDKRYKISEEYNDDEHNICPVCKEKSVISCNCVYNDKKCANNHTWYLNRDGEIRNGNPHKN